MSVYVMGDTAFLVTLPGVVNAAMLAKVRGLAASLDRDRPAGVVDVFPAYSSVAVLYEPERVNTLHGELPWHAIAHWIERHLTGKGAASKPSASRAHAIPVCYGGEHGPDLETVAKTLKLSPEAVVKLHSGASYTVAAIGFTPGFPYLLGLPPKLNVERRSTPRVRVPAGSVGLGGAQTGVYPRETPGGWQLIGRTTFEFFDPRTEPPSRLAAGDRVTFRPVEKLEPNPARANPAANGAGRGSGPARGAFVEVIKPGALTSVQDLGRQGQAGQGVGVGGALDRWAAMAVNFAVGNPPEAALLECTFVGPVLRFNAACRVAVLGAEVAGLTSGRPFVVDAGHTLDCSSFTRGARLYIAVAGGLRVPAVLGSAATHLQAGFGGLTGRALRTGDRLVIGEAHGGAPVGNDWRVVSPVPIVGKKDRIVVRLIPGPDWETLITTAGDSTPEAAGRVIEAMSFQLSAKSDCMGLRLEGDTFKLTPDARQTSRPVVPGTVQIPPDGHPIVLMTEGQTIGGYAQLGHVASLDLPQLAQARPGAEIVFRLSTVSAAQQARLAMAADLARLQVGLELRRG